MLVSHTVQGLVSSSGLVFEDVGERERKGIPDRWHLYRAVGDPPQAGSNRAVKCRSAGGSSTIR